MPIKSGREEFMVGGKPTGDRLVDFWAFYASNLIHSPLRGALAEYIVAMALGIQSGVRNTWAAYDLDYKGIAIEVKSSAYLQEAHEGISQTHQFSISAHNHFSDGEQTKVVKRHARLYVFCMLTEKDRAKVNPMELSQWDFYILPTSVLNEKYQNRVTIALSRLEMIGAKKTDYSGLKKAIDDLIESGVFQKGI